MRKLILTALCSFILYSQASAKDVFVRSYFRKDGTFVHSHYRTSPDHDMYNNYSTIGNANPYTGKSGWITPSGEYSYNKTKIHTKRNKLHNENWFGISEDQGWIESYKDCVKRGKYISLSKTVCVE